MERKQVESGGSKLRTLSFVVSVDNVCVGRNRGLDFGVGEVDDVSVLLEEVDFFDGWNVTDVKLVQGGFETLVILGSILANNLVLAADTALASCLAFGGFICGEPRELGGVERH